jgi:NhaP-type Na+/H+ or K+/H+ antiporter
VPGTLDSGEPFSGRDDIIFVTAGVIVLTLLVRGPLLPAVVRWANLPDDTDTDAELRLAEHALATTAVTALPELAAEHGISEEVHEQPTSDYEEHLRLVEEKWREPGQPASCRGGGTRGHARRHDRRRERHRDDDGRAGGGGSPNLHGAPANEEYSRLRLALLDRKREVLLRLRHEGTIDDSVARQIQTRLDIEELRLTGVEPLG